MNYLTKNYNPLAQHYGEWLRGYDWSIFGCGTFRKPMGLALAQALGKRFFERLERRLRVPVSYAAVLEHRYSGCGLSPIPAHWHFLAASTAGPNEMARAAQVLWYYLFGNAKIEPYDRSEPGTHYVAKLASHDNGLLVVSKLDRLKYRGAADLVAAAKGNPYVPDRLKDRVFGNYLVMR